MYYDSLELEGKRGNTWYPHDSHTGLASIVP